MSCSLIFETVREINVVITTFITNHEELVKNTFENRKPMLVMNYKANVIKFLDFIISLNAVLRIRSCRFG